MKMIDVMECDIQDCATSAGSSVNRCYGIFCTGKSNWKNMFQGVSFDGVAVDIVAI